MFAGIDLAADWKKTGLAILEEIEGQIFVQQVKVGVKDNEIIEIVMQTEKTGSDVPFGWPLPFIELIHLQSNGTLQAPQNTDLAWRKTLALRTTDLFIQQQTGLNPLSVSASLIAHPAFRWAGIEAKLRELQLNVARDGLGKVCEVYPAATLWALRLPHQGYKGSHIAKRIQLIEAIQQKLPFLRFNGWEALCQSNDNALDAVIADLTAWLVHKGYAQAPTGLQQEIALREGWIWLPDSLKINMDLI